MCVSCKFLWWRVELYAKKLLGSLGWKRGLGKSCCRYFEEASYNQAQSRRHYSVAVTTRNERCGFVAQPREIYTTDSEEGQQKCLEVGGERVKSKTKKGWRLGNCGAS